VDVCLVQANHGGTSARMPTYIESMEDLSVVSPARYLRQRILDLSERVFGDGFGVYVNFYAKFVLDFSIARAV
jgi:hypothetical protein